MPLRTRLVLGTVVDILETTDVDSPQENYEMIGNAPIIRPKLIEIARWISEYYCCPLQTAMTCVLPQVVRQASIAPRRLNFARLLRRPTVAELDALATKAPRQADALRALQSVDAPQRVGELAQEAGVSEAVFRSLERTGWLRIETAEVARDPFAREIFLPTTELVLNAEQRQAVDSIKEAMQTPAQPLLLFGVTGSGKTEIYLQAIRHVIDLGRTALVLVPEISLTPQTVERFKARFADAQREVAVLHSHLSGGERFDEWRNIHSAVRASSSGRGALSLRRSKTLGSSSSMKSMRAPISRRKPRAIMLVMSPFCARSGRRAVVLGSATPSMESRHNRATGSHRLLRLSQRVDDRRMPIIRVLDMRRAPRPGGADAICAPRSCKPSSNAFLVVSRLSSS